MSRVQEGAKDPREPSWEQAEEQKPVFPNNEDSRDGVLGRPTEAGAWASAHEPGPAGTKMVSLTMACSILLSMPTRLPEPLERHRETRGKEEEQVPSQVSGHPSLLPSRCFSEQPLASSTSPICCSLPPTPLPVPVTVENQGEESFVHPPTG